MEFKPEEEESKWRRKIEFAVKDMEAYVSRKVFGHNLNIREVTHG